MTVQLQGKTWNHERGLAPLLASAELYRSMNPDISIEWEAHSLQNFASFSVAALAEHYDLIVIDHPHLGAATANDALIALDRVAPPELLAELARLSVGPSFDSYVHDGHLWALPIDTAAQVAVYRPDLLNDDDVPQTWDQVESLAARGLVLWPLKPIDALCSFFTLAANRGTPCVDSSGTFISPNDAAAVLEAMAAVAMHVPPECHTWDPIVVLDALATTDTAVYVPLSFGYSNYSRTGFSGQPLRTADMPVIGDNGPVGSILGGAGLAVSAHCKDLDQAIRYALWLASPEVQSTTYVVAGGQPGLSVAWDDDEANRLTDDFFRRTRRTLEASWMRPRAAGFIDFQDAAGPIVSAHLRNGGSAHAAAQTLREIYGTLVSSN